MGQRYGCEGQTQELSKVCRRMVSALDRIFLGTVLSYNYLVPRPHYSTGPIRFDSAVVIRVSLGRLHQGLGKSYTNDFVAGLTQRRGSTWL